ncbi:MAG: hypothetical protein LKJ17_11400 [Oscillospiraceae bacterium]|jgi:hypothetical protein|nr:hypothetical protein [Oscillospiraceae bacterium]
MQPKHMRKKGGGSRAVTVILSVLAVLLGALCVLSWMLFSDPNAGKSMPQPSDDAASKVVAASVSGASVSLTAEEVGGWLNFLIRENSDTAADTGLTALSVTTKQDNTADIYFPVQYSGKTFGVTMNLSLSFDAAAEQMKFFINSVHVGRLPVPVGYALDMMGEKLPPMLSRQGETLLCNTKSLFRVDFSGMFLRLKMTEMNLKNQAFHLKFDTEAGVNG